jgi:hypothetical protein
MFFRNIIPIVLILSTFFSCTPIKKLYVPFSEAKLKYAELKDDVIRIYFDRFGFLYPDLNIPYSDFINSLWITN